jgi:hypothetical protein
MLISILLKGIMFTILIGVLAVLVHFIYKFLNGYFPDIIRMILGYKPYERKRKIRR